MRGTTYLSFVLMFGVGCGEQSSPTNPGVTNSNAKDQAETVVEGNPAQPPAKAAWTPPANPDPQKILSEAQADATAGRYEEALAKHVWFHRHALEVDPAYYGVRLSFALMYWKELAKVYPPAKAKLIEIRDVDEKQVGSGSDGVEAFTDFEAINTELGENERTVALFKSLDKNNAKVAKELFDRAQPTLIRAGETKLCAKYVDPKNYTRLAEMYRQIGSREADPQFGKEHTEFVRQTFSNEVSTLVALLVLSERKSEAEKIAADAKKEWDDKAFAEKLNKALEGKVPEPWPPVD